MDNPVIMFIQQMVVADFHQLKMLIQLFQKWYIFIHNLWNNYVHPYKSVIISIDIWIIYTNVHP